MAQRTDSRRRGARTPEKERRVWWVTPAVALGVIGCAVLPYLHVRFGSTSSALAAGTTLINLVVFLGTYLISRSIKPKQAEGSLSALVTSLIVSLPVFILALLGLGYEMPVLADVAAAYIAGIWIGSSEAAEMHRD